jgi:gamma-glutamylcyclotransferase (GGCT)/AIG2-like uncharacterized protein YtfP
MENLFSYGTLQLESVQLSTFHRTLEGSPDVLAGYKVSHIEITDPEVVAASGLTHHLMISFTGKESDIIQGVVLKVTTEELAQADEYEASDYKRVSVILKSGRRSWVYVDANDNA